MEWISNWESSSRDIGLLAIEFVISNFLAPCLLNRCGCKVQPNALQLGLAKRNRPLQIPVSFHCSGWSDCGVEGSRNAAPP